MARTVTDQDTLKRGAGEAAAAEVTDGQVVGLGTGSTVEWTIRALARRVADDGLDIVGIPTSERSDRLARELGIRLTTLADHPEVDITIDGADEVDRDFDLVKGGGGALTREKIVAAASHREVIVVDPSKLVNHLGDAFPLPVEVVPMAVPTVTRALADLGFEVMERMAREQPFVTDNGMRILDARMPGGIRDKAALEADIDLLPGVLENGLFLGMCDLVVVGTPEGPVRLARGQWVD